MWFLIGLFIGMFIGLVLMAAGQTLNEKEAIDNGFIKLDRKYFCIIPINNEKFINEKKGQ